MQTHVQELLAMRDALAAASTTPTVYDVAVRLGIVGDARSNAFVPGLDAWTWHATFEALYDRDETAVSVAVRTQYFRHANDTVEAVNDSGQARWFRTLVRAEHTHAGAGALPCGSALHVVLTQETACARAMYGRLAAAHPRATPTQDLEERVLRSVRLPTSPWRIDFTHVMRHWPLQPLRASRESYEITLVWAPLPPSTAPSTLSPTASLDMTLALLQTAAAASEHELRALIAEHMDTFERTRSFS